MLLERTIIKKYCLNEIKNEWLSSKNSFPDFFTEVSEEIKNANEQYIQTVSANFQKLIKGYSRLPIKQGRWKRKTYMLLQDILYNETIIGVHHSMDQFTIDAFYMEIKDFLRHERSFSPELSIEGIGQAIRNYIVYAMFNVIHQLNPSFRMAGFGYSMLYPFTDNYIDSDQYSTQDKIEYNQLIRDKIEGKEVNPKSIHAQKTCELLQAIESEYPRDKDSRIYMLLLMILEAQEESLLQQRKSICLSYDECLDISIYKGATSVLVDRFIVKKEITEEDLIFYLGFGFFLQLADDLQDIKEDSKQGHQTLFTIDLSCEREEKIVNQMLYFIHRLMDSYHAENDSFKNFILSNCDQLIFSSLIGSKEFFSVEYIEQMEQFFSVSYSFLEKITKSPVETKDISLQMKYMKIIDDMIN